MDCFHENKVYDVFMKTRKRLSSAHAPRQGDYVLRVPAQLSAYLRTIRRQRGLTQKEMARRLAMTQQALSQLERNASSASFERIVRYCRLLDMTVVLRDSGADVITKPEGGW